MIRVLLVFNIVFYSCSNAQTQTQFEKEVVKRFPLLDQPPDSVQKLNPKDTLNKKLYNFYLKNTIADRPIYIVNGKRELEMDYYGILKTRPSNVAQYDNNHRPLPDIIFYDKAYPIGRIELQSDYYSLIVKVFSLLSTYYDIHNFTRDGKLLSVVPLYYFENSQAMEDRVGILHVKSKIDADGKIYWWEYYPNRTRERVYSLNKEGFFEVVSEKASGVLEN
ncbi:MAG: hypothetical protein R2804_12830 [Cyclobacteriaceae bacterium]